MVSTAAAPAAWAINNDSTADNFLGKVSATFGAYIEAGAADCVTLTEVLTIVGTGGAGLLAETVD